MPKRTRGPSFLHLRPPFLHLTVRRLSLARETRCRFAAFHRDFARHRWLSSPRLITTERQKNVRRATTPQWGRTVLVRSPCVPSGCIRGDNTMRQSMRQAASNVTSLSMFVHSFANISIPRFRFYIENDDKSRITRIHRCIAVLLEFFISRRATRERERKRERGDRQIPSGGDAARSNVLPHRTLYHCHDRSFIFGGCLSRILFMLPLRPCAGETVDDVSRDRPAVRAHLNRRGIERPMWYARGGGRIGVSTTMPTASVAASVDRGRPRFREHGVGRHCDSTGEIRPPAPCLVKDEAPRPRRDRPRFRRSRLLRLATARLARSLARQSPHDRFVAIQLSASDIHSAPARRTKLSLARV